MHESAILFPAGVRLSTWVTLAVFLVLGLRDRRYWLAAAAWLVGFELLFQMTNTVNIVREGGFHPASWWQPIVVFGAYMVGLGFLVFAARRGARPALPLIALALAAWIALIVGGFHINSHTMTDFDAKAEALNEAAKTLWAVAYIVVLWRLDGRGLEERIIHRRSVDAAA